MVGGTGMGDLRAIPPDGRTQGESEAEKSTGLKAGEALT